jgi:hypothetical protein
MGKKVNNWSKQATKSSQLKTTSNPIKSQTSFSATTTCRTKAKHKNQSTNLQQNKRKAKAICLKYQFSKTRMFLASKKIMTSSPVL